MTLPLFTLPVWWKRLGPFLPLFGLAIPTFLLLSFSRFGHTLTYAERVRDVDGWAWLFVVGLRMDSVLVSFLMILPAFLLLALPASCNSFVRRSVTIISVLFFMSVLFMELATVRFLEEFDHRPDRLFWEYLSYPREVMETVIKSAWGSLIAAAIILPLTTWGAWLWFRLLSQHMESWKWWVRLAVLPLVAGILVLGVRGTLSHRPVNISTAAFSNENLLNQLALNSTYTATYALYSMRHEANAAAIYGKMPAEKIIAHVRRAMLVPEADFSSSTIPLLHRVQAVQERDRPYNLVIILEESLGAQFVGCLGGMPLTPEFDALSKEGLLLTKLYSTGTRTVRGIEAVVAGFPPSPAKSTVKLGMSQRDFFTPALLLGRHGYESFFFYGGESHFDNMRSFFQGNGFAKIVDQPSFAQPEFVGVWGVCDGDLARRAASDLAVQGNKPFVAVMLSTSNHVPFEFPDGHIELYEQPKQTRHNAMKYADWAIGEFFRQARKHDYYKDTIFLVVADHNIRTIGNSLVPVSAFHIPGLIIGPGFTPGVYDKVCSQLDLLPTILPRLGLNIEHPLMGHDLLALPSDYAGRAIMQFGNAHGYRLGSRLVVHQPREAARCFFIDERDLITATDETWPDLTDEALAHALLSTHLYSNRLHALPAK